MSEYVQMRLTRKPVERIEMGVGDAVLFTCERNEFTVRAVSADGRWVICTRPPTDADRLDMVDADGDPLINDDETVLYTVIDWDCGVRGPDNYSGLGYRTSDEIAAALLMFEAGDAEISVRYDVTLDVAAVRRVPA